nr:retrovirus-related Pol polyprotein from transposon TNT 1-94 [Tanacetum cinerariifolium]
MFTSTVFDCDELNSFELDVSVPTSPVHDRYKSGAGYHAVPLPYTRTFMPPRPDLVFHDASTISETITTVFNVEPSTTKPTKEISQSNRPSAPIIKDWVSDSEDESEGEPMLTQKAPSFVQTFEHVKTLRISIKPVEHPTQVENLRKDISKSRMIQKPVWNHAMRANHQNSTRMTYSHSKKHVVPTTVLTRSRILLPKAAIPVTTVIPQTTMKTQRPVKHVVNKPYSPIRRPIHHRPAPKHSNFHQKVTTVKTKKVNVVQGTKGNWGNLQQALKDKGVIDIGFSRHMTGNISYLSDFEEINEGYVAFGGNLKSGKITGKDTECVVLPSNFKLPDENHVLLRVLRENNMYNVDLKNIVPLGDLTCLFAKATLDESNLWHRRLGHINFKTMNKLVKGIKREFSVARTPQQNGVAKKKNRTLIEAAKTMLADSLLPILFWAEAVNTAFYIQNRVLVIKPHNKTPYELLLGRTPSIGFMRPFGCHVTILNTLDPLGKFDGKADEGFLVGYSVSSKAFRVFNSRTRIVQETLHINFLENQPNVAGSGPTWWFYIDTLTQSMNYQPVVAGNQPNHNAGIQGNFDAGKVVKEVESSQQYVLLPLWSTGLKDHQNIDADAAFDVKENESEVHVSLSSSDKPKKHDEKAKREAKGKSRVDFSIGVRDLSDEFEEFSINSTNRVNAASIPVTVVGPNSTNSINNFNAAGPFANAVSPNFEIGKKSSFVDTSQYPDDPDMPTLKDIVYSDDEKIVYKHHPVTQIIGDLSLAPQTRSMTRMVKEQDLPKGKRAIGSKWGFRNKKDERGIVIRNKARLVAHRHTQEEGIDYEEVFAPVARIEAIQLFLANASFIGFMVYQMDVKSSFCYETIEEEVYVCQPLGFEDPDYPDKVYKVVKALYGLHQAPKAWKFGLTDGKSASAPIDTEKPLLKDHDDEDVDVHIIGCRLISWQCKKQTVVATSSTEAEYVAVASYCAQLLWIQISCWTMEDEDNEVSIAPTLLSPTPATTPPPPQQEPIPSPPQVQYAQPSSPLQQQPSQTIDILESSMTLINKLMETCATLTQKVANLEQDKVAQALKITKLKQMEDASKQGGKITELDANKDVILVDVDAEVEMDVNIQGRMVESRAKAYNLDLQHSKKVLSMQDTDEAAC